MFNLTTQERRVVLFLIIVGLIGVGVDFLIKKRPPASAIAFFTQDIGKIDLNKADKETLMSVQGIGEKLAQRIIEYRNIHVTFKETEELKNIKGITNLRFEKIKNSFVVR